MLTQHNKHFLITFWVCTALMAYNSQPTSIQNPEESISTPSHWKDRLFHRREFHEPIKFIPLELRYGIGYYGGGGNWVLDTKSNWIRYDQAVTRFDGGEVNGRILHAIDLDFFKTNFTHFILKSSWADIVSGINFRYASLLYSNSLPISEWGQTNTSWGVGSKQFSPRILSLGLSHSLHLQWFETWFIQSNYTFGLASSKFYQTTDGGLDADPSGWGTAVSYSIGIRYILDPGLDNRFSVGLEFHNGYTKINRISDNNEVTPIKGFTLQDFGVRLSLSAFYGGKRTSGDLAKSYFYQGDYLSSRENFAAFIKEYPNHTNRYKAEEFLKACNIKIPEQLFIEGKQFEEHNQWEKAVERFERAKLLTKNSELKNSVNHHLNRIARIQLHNAEILLENKSAQDAYKLVMQTSRYSNEAQDEMNRFQAEALLAKAQKAMDHGLIYKSLEFINLALEVYPDFAAKSSALRYRAAGLLISDANTAEDSEDITFAIYSLENAKKISGGLGEKNEKILDELLERLALIDERDIRKSVIIKTDTERQKLEAKIKGRINIGMTVPQIQDRLGEPHQRKLETVKGEDIQLWIYHLEKGNDLQLSFREFILFKIDEK